ncbi:hypothetical protein KDV52_02110 [Providencia rettgeri]|uniref:hypothetical protein n=1 Tax=Providencia sp. PROV158 TaxID=2949868 RepID=UPI00234A264A|nr:hypothetical protein [Providencia sp. PROV158]
MQIEAKLAATSLLPINSYTSNLDKNNNVIYLGSVMDIKIESPIRISFETIGFEDDYGSIEFKITIGTSGFDYNQSISFNTWIAYYHIDAFLNALNENKKAELVNLDGNFSLIIDSNENYIEWSHIEFRYSDNIFSTFKARREVNDFYYNIVKSFNDYPKWW